MADIFRDTREMWTHAERTAIQSLLRRGIPIAIIIHILLMNRHRGVTGWRVVRNVFGVGWFASNWPNILGPNDTMW